MMEVMRDTCMMVNGSWWGETHKMYVFYLGAIFLIRHIACDLR